MIFVVTGSGPYPFRRLVNAMDAYAPTSAVPILVQKGATDTDSTYFESFTFCDYDSLVDKYRSASLIVSHVSTGPLLYSRFYSKPIICLPRLAEFGESLNNHQLHVAKRLSSENNRMRSILFDPADIPSAIERMLRLSGRSYDSADTLFTLRKALRSEMPDG